MGLSLCQSLIRDYSGEINYVRKDQGACFEIILPVIEHQSIVETPTHASKIAMREPVASENSILKILVVEDEPELAEIVKDCLELEGVQVDIAANGLLGLQAMKSHHYDVVITDQSMPVMDGKTMIKTVYAEKLSSMSARIFLFTGAIDHILSEADLKLDCFKRCEILPKPIGQNELRRRVLDEFESTRSVKVN